MRIGARVLHADGPLADVDVVGAPVGELAAGVLVPPAEIAVAPLLAVVDLGRLAEPHVPVQLGGGLRHGERAAGRAVADGRRDLPDLADPARADHGHGQQEHPVVVAPLLGADLDDPAGLLGDLAELLALVDGQRQRLLAVDVLARPHGVDADLGVPVVGRADDDGVDILAIEELAVVLVDVGLPLADATVGLGLLGVALVDVADGQEVAVLGGPAGVARTLAAARRSGRGRGRSFLARVSSAIERPKGMKKGNSAGLVAATRRKSRRFCVRMVIVADLREDTVGPTLPGRTPSGASASTPSAESTL